MIFFHAHDRSILHIIVRIRFTAKQKLLISLFGNWLVLLMIFVFRAENGIFSNLFFNFG